MHRATTPKRASVSVDSLHTYTPTETTQKGQPTPPSHLPSKIAQKKLSTGQDDHVMSSSSPLRLGYGKEKNTAPPTPLEPSPAKRESEQSPHPRPTSSGMKSSSVPPPPPHPIKCSRAGGPPKLTSVSSTRSPIVHPVRSSSPNASKQTIVMPPSVAPPPPPNLTKGLPESSKLPMGLSRSPSQEGSRVHTPSAKHEGLTGSSSVVRNLSPPTMKGIQSHQRVISNASITSTATVFIVPSPKNSSQAGNTNPMQSSSSVQTKPDPPTKVMSDKTQPMPSISEAPRSSSTKAAEGEDQRPVTNPNLQTAAGNNSFSVRSESGQEDGFDSCVSASQMSPSLISRADGLSPRGSPMTPGMRNNVVSSDALFALGDRRPESLIFQRSLPNENINRPAKRRSAASSILGSSFNPTTLSKPDTAIPAVATANAGYKSIMILVQERLLLDVTSATNSPSSAAQSAALQKRMPQPQLFTFLFPQLPFGQKDDQLASTNMWKTMTVGELKEVVTNEYLATLLEGGLRNKDDGQPKGEFTQPTPIGNFVFQRKSEVKTSRSLNQSRHVFLFAGRGQANAATFSSPLTHVAATVLPAVGTAVSSQLFRDGIPLADTHSLGLHDYRLGQHEVLQLQIYRVADSRLMTGSKAEKSELSDEVKPSAGPQRRLLPSASKVPQGRTEEGTEGLTFARRPVRQSVADGTANSAVSIQSIERSSSQVHYPTPRRHTSPSSIGQNPLYGTPLRSEQRLPHRRILVSPDPSDPY